MEIPLPDRDARRRLLALYARGLDLRLGDEDSVVAATSGVTASFIKELVRKSALIAAIEADGAGDLTVTDEHVNAALTELLAEGSALTRILLGGSRGSPANGRAHRPGTEWLEDGGDGDS